MFVSVDSENKECTATPKQYSKGNNASHSVLCVSKANCCLKHYGRKLILVKQVDNVRILLLQGKHNLKYVLIITPCISELLKICFRYFDS